jgi:hypothetical protein
MPDTTLEKVRRGSEALSLLLKALNDGKYAPAAMLVDVNGNALGGAGGTSMLDDAAFTAGGSSLTPIGGVNTADLIDAGDVGAVGLTLARGMHVNLRDASGTELGGVASPLQVEGTWTAGLESPKVYHVTTAAVAPNAPTNLDSDQIAVGKTGKLLGLVVAASVPFKAELKTLLNGAASAVKMTRFAEYGWDWTSPHRDFVTQAYSATAGLDGFRVVVTNLTTGSAAADVYCTFLYDEVTP